MSLLESLKHCNILVINNPRNSTNIPQNILARIEVVCTKTRIKLSMEI